MFFGGLISLLGGVDNIIYIIKHTTMTFHVKSAYKFHLDLHLSTTGPICGPRPCVAAVSMTARWCSSAAPIGPLCTARRGPPIACPFFCNSRVNVRILNPVGHTKFEF